MTREEQIMEAGVYYACGIRPPKTYGHSMYELAYISRNLAFEAGAKWADEHPNSNHIYTKQQLIDMGFAFTTNGDIVTPEQENKHLKRYLKYKNQTFIENTISYFTPVLKTYCSEECVKELIDGFVNSLEE